MVGAAHGGGKAPASRRTARGTVRARRLGRLAAPFAALLAVLALAVPARAASPLWASSQGRDRVFQALVDIFRDRYWDPGWMDWQAWAARYRAAVVGAGSRATFDSVMRQMVDAVHDDHSSWLGLASYGGGATAPQETPTIGVETAYLQGEGLVVTRVLPGSPAADADVRRGDVITRVGSEALDGSARWDAGVVLSRAVQAGDVALGLRRGRQVFDRILRPALLARRTLSEQPTGRMLDATTGYIYLPSLNQQTTGARFHQLLGELEGQGATSLIVDMRGNYGGRLGQLGLVLGAFTEGAWAQAVSRGGVVWQGRYAVVDGEGVSTLVAGDGTVVEEDRLAHPTHFDGPLVVLVDADNSSAGEVGPLVLQDLGRARVVGERTHGNVEAVQGFTLPDGSVVMVAVANMEGIDGRAFDGGIVPAVTAHTSLAQLARGYDAPVAAAQALLHGLPFDPGRLF